MNVGILFEKILKINQRMVYIRTGKLQVMLKLNAAISPQTRKVTLDWEYFLPHVGLLRMSSALNETIEIANMMMESLHLAIPNVDRNDN